jgi:hypothetical protein
MNTQTGRPIVSELAGLGASRYGETSVTKTQEGMDQLESLEASRFGETLVTETREGIDQSERL